MSGKGRDRPERGSGADAGPELIQHLVDAYEEWQAAQRFFSEVAEQEMVEWATFYLKACEERYRYLWRKARQAGLRVPVLVRRGWA
ncbi:MAG: DUF2508 family protein [Clostridia bacterium]|jgi:vacuolar-type H+-ATPase subunit B/Vma2|nr:YaaL family protein [Clostridia bacterium]MDH7573808.1 DUF2508 family protein [Clostridia bacterium]